MVMLNIRMLGMRKFVFRDIFGLATLNQIEWMGGQTEGQRVGSLDNNTFSEIGSFWNIYIFDTYIMVWILCDDGCFIQHHTLAYIGQQLWSSVVHSVTNISIVHRHKWWRWWWWRWQYCRRFFCHCIHFRTQKLKIEWKNFRANCNILIAPLFRFPIANCVNQTDWKQASKRSFDSNLDVEKKKNKKRSNFQWYVDLKESNDLLRKYDFNWILFVISFFQIWNVWTDFDESAKDFFFCCWYNFKYHAQTLKLSR